MPLQLEGNALMALILLLTQNGGITERKKSKLHMPHNTSNTFNATYGNPVTLFSMYMCKGTFSLVPRPPFNTSRGKGGLVNIEQHFCRSEEFRRDNLIGWCGNYLTCTGLPYRKPLSFTHHTFTDLLSTPSNLQKPSKRLQRLGFSGIHCNS